jgi:tetratricopeptide (TPR) repeat protein
MMSESHPNHDRLAMFSRGLLDRTECREITRHLLTGCESCRAVASAGVDASRSSSELYEKAFTTAFVEFQRRRSLLEQEQYEAPTLLEELRSHPFERQRWMVNNRARFRTWALCNLLLESSHDWGFQEPSRALELADLSTIIASSLNPVAYGEARVADLSARAWAVLANAQRICSDLRSAEISFASAEKKLRAGTGDPLERARILLLRASLHGDQRQFEEAHRILDRAISVGRRHGDSQITSKGLIKKGIYFGIACQYEDAIECLGEGVRLIDPQSEPRLAVAARHNLIVYLTESGRLEEAGSLLEVTRPLYSDLGDAMNLIRLRWLEGNISVAEGRLDLAEEIYRGVGRDLIDRGLGYDAALLSLDLAGVLARQGRSEEMRDLAMAMLPIFRSRDVHREAFAALVVFRKAAEMDRVTLSLVQELSGYLRQCRTSPGLRFRDSV